MRLRLLARGVFAVLRGGDAEVRLEFFAEIEGVVEAQHLGDLVHGEVRDAHKLPRLLHQELGLIFGGRAALIFGK